MPAWNGQTNTQPESNLNLQLIATTTNTIKRSRKDIGAPSGVSEATPIMPLKHSQYMNAGRRQQQHHRYQYSPLFQNRAPVVSLDIFGHQLQDRRNVSLELLLSSPFSRRQGGGAVALTGLFLPAILLGRLDSTSSLELFVFSRRVSLHTGGRWGW